MESLRNYLGRSLERKFVFFLVAMVGIAIVSVSSVATGRVRTIFSASFQTKVSTLLAVAAEMLEEGQAPDIDRIRRVLSIHTYDPDLTALLFLRGGPPGRPELLAGVLPLDVTVDSELVARPSPVFLPATPQRGGLIAWSTMTRVGAVVALFAHDRTELFFDDMNIRLQNVWATVCLLSCFLGLFMARLILRPLQRFIVAMRDIAQGKEVERLTSVEATELGEWTETFNLMLTQVRQRHAMEKFLLHREQSELVMHIAAGLAHRIRTPLTAINSLTQLITRGNDRRKLEEWTGVILTKVKELDEAVNQFLEYAKPVALRFEPIRVSETIGLALQILRPQLEARQIRIEFAAATAGEKPQLADSEQLQQAFIHLFRSSSSSMKPDGCLRIAFEPEEGGKRAAIRVEDTAEPIPPEMRERIFEPFVDQTSRHTGVGLAVAQRLFERHGGTLELTSSGPGGNVFRAVLPSLTREELELASGQTST